MTRRVRHAPTRTEIAEVGPIEYTPDRARWPRWIMAALATVLMLADAALLALALPLI